MVVARMAYIGSRALWGSVPDVDTWDTVISRLCP
jgi:hypothetical protein